MLRALKRTIKRREDIPDLETDKAPDALLMNETRQKILQYLCRYPCIHLSGIAKDLKLSFNASKWHLNKLVDNGLLQTKKIGNKLVYFPTDMIDNEDIDLLAIANNERNRPMIHLINRTPGITQKEICDNVNRKQQTLVADILILEEIGLITSKKDGKFRRYYPTDELKIRSKANRKRSNQFRQHLLNSMIKDGVEPVILRTTDKKIYIQILSGKDKSNLIINTNPFDQFFTA
jgi:DNA-binding MarR family transcriptional regulator